MKEIQWLVFALHLAAGSLIVKRTANYDSDDPAFEPVPLLTKSPEAVKAASERTARIRETPKDLLQSLGYANKIEDVESRNFPDPDDDQLPSTDDYEESEEYSDEATTKAYSVTTSWPELSTTRLTVLKKLGIPAVSPNRTKLYPVARHDDRTLPSRPMPGIMEILDAAFSCIWSGLGFECFSVKVVPMFRAMMGFPTPNPFGQPYYVLPRTSDAGTESGVADGEGRRRRHALFGFKLVKGALIGLTALKALIIPILSALSIVSGNAIVFSVAAVFITLAIAWSGPKSADRRVYNPPQHTPYYM